MTVPVECVQQLLFAPANRLTAGPGPCKIAAANLQQNQNVAKVAVVALPTLALLFTIAITLSDDPQEACAQHVWQHPYQPIKTRTVPAECQ